MARIIGLTGGIASGKSTVTSYLREKGYPVIDADQVVHDLQAPGGALYRVLVDHFGREILTKEGELDRVALGQRIFSDPSERDWSNRVQGRLIREALASQMPLDEKRVHADLVLDNNGDLTALYAQLDAALKQLERR